MKPSLEREQRLFDALKRITRYMKPDELARRCDKLYGLPYDDALEMSYENVMEEARQAIKGLRRPTAPVGVQEVPRG
jgi:hypothetical protein